MEQKYKLVSPLGLNARVDSLQILLMFTIMEKWQMENQSFH